MKCKLCGQPEGPERPVMDGVCVECTFAMQRNPWELPAERPAPGGIRFVVGVLLFAFACLAMLFAENQEQTAAGITAAVAGFGLGVWGWVVLMNSQDS